LDERLASIKHLIDEGHADRVMLGTDFPIGMALVPTAEVVSRDVRNPDGILFVRRKVIPRLKEMGVQESSVRSMTVENPRRFFDSI